MASNRHSNLEVNMAFQDHISKAQASVVEMQKIAPAPHGPKVPCPGRDWWYFAFNVFTFGPAIYNPPATWVLSHQGLKEFFDRGWYAVLENVTNGGGPVDGLKKLEQTLSVTVDPWARAGSTKKAITMCKPAAFDRICSLRTNDPAHIRRKIFDLAVHSAREAGALTPLALGRWWVHRWYTGCGGCETWMARFGTLPFWVYSPPTFVDWEFLLDPEMFPVESEFEDEIEGDVVIKKEEE